MEEGIRPRRIFVAADYVVLTIFLLISVGIGIFYAIKDKRNNSSSNYFLGNRKLKTIPLGLSYVVTFQSAIMILGTPAEVYVYGLQYVLVLVGTFIGIVMSALIVVPLFHPLNITSVYEYYNLRYNGTNSVRYLGVILGMIYYLVYMAIVLFGTALALDSTTGLPLWVTIIMFSTAAVIYTSIGGIKAVIWTDVFQTLIMFAGILAVLIKSTISAGGPSNISQISKDRFNFFNFNPDPTIRHSFWTLILGSIPQYFYMTITQAGVQRIMSTPSVASARRLLYIASPIFCVLWLLVMFEGITLFAYFSNKGCDPLASHQVSNPNQIIPFTILEMFHDLPGMPGLFIAALAAASMSTVSSGLSGLSAVLCVDVLKVWKPEIKDGTATNVSRFFVVVLGILSALLAFVLSGSKGPLNQVMAAISGAVAGPETGMFLVSAFYRRSRPKAVLFATLLGLAFNLWMILGNTFSTNILATPYLPPGPVNQCNAGGDTVMTYASNESFSLGMNLLNRTSSLPPGEFVHASTTPDSRYEAANNNVSGLGLFYSVSYMYVHLIGTVVTVVLAIVGSLICRQKQSHVKDKYVLSMRKILASTPLACCYSEKNGKETNDNKVDGETEYMMDRETKTFTRV